MPQLGMDLHEGGRLANAEKYGDWYRDPWGWPECGLQFAESLDVEEDLSVVRDGRRYVSALQPAFHPFSVPKSFLGMRPAVVQDAKSRLAYITAAAGVAKTFHADLPDWVYGWRYREGRFTSSSAEWSLYEDSKAGIETSPHAAQTDVSSFFASIEVRHLLDVLEPAAPRSIATSVIGVVLQAHDDLATRSGIPQRSMGSSLLAHAALSSIDDLVDSRLAAGDVVQARRWMDDISFEGPEAALYALLTELQAKAREAGLELNMGKTMLTTGQVSAARLEEEAQKRIVVPRVTGDFAVSGGGESSYLDPSELEAQESHAIGSPTTTSRSLLVAILRSLSHYQMFGRASDWMSISHRIPHAADALSRYLTASRDDIWGPQNFEGWFSAEVDSRWRLPDWVLAQHALVFSASELPPSVATILRTWLANSTNLQQLAVAIHRLSAVEPRTVRSVLTGRIDRARDPLVLRLVGLGLLASGATERQVRRALEAHSSNSLAIKYLDAHGWILPRVAVDFDYAAAISEEADEAGDLPA